MSASQPDKCRPGRYRANSTKILDLRMRSGLNEPAFCKAARISPTVLERAEKNGCNFAASLQRIADALGVKSWRDLIDDSETVDPVPEIPRSTLRQITFDRIVDPDEFLARVEQLINRRIPCTLIAFEPIALDDNAQHHPETLRH